jgi:hypothetical protein
LRRRIGGFGGHLAGTLARIVLAATVMGGVGVAVDRASSAALPASASIRYALELAIATPVCLSSFLVMAHLLGVPLPWGRRPSRVNR